MFQKLKGFFLIFLVVLLSLVFALQFGGGQAEGCTAGGSTYLARVYDHTISKGDLDAAYAIGKFDRLPPESQAAMRLPEIVLDGLVERTLLAREAKRLGFTISEEKVMEQFVTEGVILLTLGVEAPPYLPQGEIPVVFTDRDGQFDADLAKRYVQNGLRRSMSEFAQAQVDERLAARMRELIAATVNVSDSEVWSEFQRETDKAKIKYVRFSPGYYQKDQPKGTPQELADWMARNDDRLEGEYELSKHRFTGLEKQVRSRHILIKSSPAASESEKAKAKAKAEALRKRAAAGADFAALAEKNSEDIASAKKGGDLGYNPRGRMVQAFDDAQFALEPGVVSEVIESPFGFHVIKVEGTREGDVPKEEAKAELAEKMFRDDWTASRAQAEAERILQSWRAADSDETIAKKLEADAAASMALAPTLKESELFGRGDNPIPGLPASQLIDVVFAMTDGATFPDTPMKLGRDWVIFKLVEREKPDVDAFTGDAKAGKREALRTLKEQEALRLYIKQLRDRAEADKAIRIKQAPKANDKA